MSITVTIVVVTGIVGATLGPLLIKIFNDKDDVLVGLSLGSSSHAVGTSKAFDYSSKAGSIATISIVTNGLLTVLVAIIMSLFIN
jgi:putative effector of murein hydrolase